MHLSYVVPVDDVRFPEVMQRVSLGKKIKAYGVFKTGPVTVGINGNDS